MAEKKGKDGIWKVVKKFGARITSLEKQMKNMKGQFGEKKEVEDDRFAREVQETLCKFMEALGALKIAGEYDTTTGESLNSLIGVVKKFFGDIDVDEALETDTTTATNLNSLIEAVKGFLPDLDVEDAKEVTTTGTNLNNLFVAIIKEVAAPICG